MSPSGNSPASPSATQWTRPPRWPWACWPGASYSAGPRPPPRSASGSRVRARPFPLPFPDWDPSSLPFEEMPRRARAVLDRCPSWLDDSALTYELAEEIALREGDPSPDPRRDAGAYRYLFEHRLQGQLE